METLLRIQAIKVSGLFGYFEHHVPINLDERICIIHGTNGVGKTALLRLINNFINGRYLQLLRVPFDRFEITLSDSSVIGVRQISHEGKTQFEVFKRLSVGEEQKELIPFQSLESKHLLKALDAELPWIRQIGIDEWVDVRTDTLYQGDELIGNFSSYLPDRIKKRLFKEPNWLVETRKRISTHLIETQRLLNIPTSQRSWGYSEGRGGERIVSTVQSYARELKNKIETTLAQYAKESQSLDQSFPQRLLNGPLNTLDIEDLKLRMEELEKKRSDLKKIGLIDEDAAYPFDVTSLDHLDATKKSVMTLYVEDTQKKLSVLDDLASRIGILLDNINRKFKYKSLRIEKNDGLIALDRDGKRLDLDSLSSGEQHELVLLYDLLFRVQPNTMVLIDEPELSLHISWQKSFLSDLEKIVGTANFDVLLATHSPYIAGDRHDLMVALGDEAE